MVKVENLTKTFWIYRKQLYRLFGFFPSLKEKFALPFTALEDVSFSLKDGAQLGIIGRNGSGKSTLLRLICGIGSPTKGTIKVVGRTTALLELGAGFHPELTGMENISLSCTLLGFSQDEIDDVKGDIVEFSGLGDFIDREIKTYSTGMVMRLGFAVSVMVKPKVLIIDEALSVGDQAFQNKCIKRLKEMIKEGVTVIVVSHSVGTLQQLCTEILWLEQGRVMGMGEPKKIIQEYVRFLENKNSAQIDFTKDAENPHSRYGSFVTTIDKVSLTGLSGDSRERFETGEPMVIHVEFSVKRPVPNPTFAFAIHSSAGECVTGFNSRADNFFIDSITQKGEIIVEFPQLRLLSGKYFLTVAIFDEKSFEAFDYHDQIYSFEVEQTAHEAGFISLPRRYRFSSGSVSLSGDGAPW